MAKVLVNEFYTHGMKEPKRTYAVKGGLWPPAIATINGERYRKGWEAGDLYANMGGIILFRLDIPLSK